MKNDSMTIWVLAFFFMFFMIVIFGMAVAPGLVAFILIGYVVANFFWFLALNFMGFFDDDN